MAGCRWRELFLYEKVPNVGLPKKKPENKAVVKSILTFTVRQFVYCDRSFGWRWITRRKKKNQNDNFFINDGVYASVVFEKDYNDALDVDGDFLDEEPEAWDDFDDEKLAVSVMSTRLKKLRQTQGEQTFFWYCLRSQVAGAIRENLSKTIFGRWME